VTISRSVYVGFTQPAARVQHVAHDAALFCRGHICSESVF